MSSRYEMDENAAYLYEELEVFVENRCSGTRTHSVMHGFRIGLLAGLWLNSDMKISDVLHEYGDLPVLLYDDTGD